MAKIRAQREVKGKGQKLNPTIAQLAEHLTVDIRSYQSVPGSIPGGRIIVRVPGLERQQ